MFYVSVYLRLLPEDRADRPPRYLLRFKNLVRGFKEFIKEKGLDERDYEGVFSDFDRIEDFISHPKNLEGGRGIAIFSNGQEGIWEVHKLPFVYRDALVVDIEPYKREMYAIEMDFGKNLIVDFGKKHLNIFLVDTKNFVTIQEKEDFTFWSERPSTFRYAVGNVAAYRTTGAKHFEMLKAEEDSRLAKYVANEIFEIYKKEKFDNLFLSSTDEKLIPLVRSYLHPYVARTFKGTLEIPHPTNKNQVFEILLDKIREIDLEEENEIANRFEESLALEMAVRGLQPTINIALLGNVEILIVDPDYHEEGFICHPSGFYGKLGDCPTPSDKKVLTPDIVNKLIDHVLSLNGRVEVANAERLRKAIAGSVGAILRWKIEAKV